MKTVDKRQKKNIQVYKHQKIQNQSSGLHSTFEIAYTFLIKLVILLQKLMYIDKAELYLENSKCFHSLCCVL